MGVLNDVTLTPSLNVLCANINCFNQTRPLFEKEKIPDNRETHTKHKQEQTKLNSTKKRF